MLPGTQVWSRARTKALFDEEQQFIAPGLQTIALLSELAIERGRGSTLTDLDGNTYLDLNAGVSVASLGHAHPRYVAALDRAAARGHASAASRRAPRADARASSSPSSRRATSSACSSSAAAPRRSKRRSSSRARTRSAPTSSASPAGFTARRPACCRFPTSPGRTRSARCRPAITIAPFPDPTRFDGIAGRVPRRRRSRRCAGSIAEQCRRAPGRDHRRADSGHGRQHRAAAGFLARVLEVARERGALLIADEMITGFGRTGLMFGCNHDGVVPDIMTMGKGMASGFPVSAVISTDAIVAAEPFSLPSASSSSYGGNPLAAAAALVTIRTIRRRRAGRELGARRAAVRWTACAARRAAAVDRERARARPARRLRSRRAGRATQAAGARCATFCRRTAASTFFKECLANGVILMGYTPRVRIHPPLILTADEADQRAARSSIARSTGSSRS